MAAETAPMTTIGDCLRATREHHGLTLERAAELSGMATSHLSRLESSERQPSVASLLALSAAFGVPVGTLFGDLRKLKFSLTDAAGWAAGTAAADNAELGVHKKLPFATAS